VNYGSRCAAFRVNVRKMRPPDLRIIARRMNGNRFAIEIRMSMSVSGCFLCRILTPLLPIFYNLFQAQSTHLMQVRSKASYVPPMHSALNVSISSFGTLARRSAFATRPMMANAFPFLQSVAP